jgi:hypothetical protein
LPDEQAKVVAVSLKPLAVCDGNGRVLGTIAPIWTEEDVADAERRLASDYITTLMRAIYLGNDYPLGVSGSLVIDGNNVGQVSVDELLPSSA